MLIISVTTTNITTMLIISVTTTKSHSLVTSKSHSYVGDNYVGVKDTKLILMDKLYKHLQLLQAHAWILSADFSYTMQATILAQKLISNVSLQHDLVLWIVDFLTHRCQQVFETQCKQSPALDPPWGCVLSPLLCILYTDNCQSNQESTI